MTGPSPMTATPSGPLWSWPARDLVAAMKARQASAREVLDAHLARIDEVNPRVNALVSLDPDRAREAALAADEKVAREEPTGVLHGLPFAFKDTHAVAGWRTTYGSPLFKDHVPDYDDLTVARVRAAGAVVVGRSNTPEFAAGSHTFNTVFGTTVNPYDLTRSAGGSSGGAAAALASGMVPLADGSDMGGSLRNPASFCNVVGLRPSLGRVPQWPVQNAWETTGVAGPLARDVGDVALLLSVLAGPDVRVPTALSESGSVFWPLAGTPPTGLRVALAPDLGGAYAVDPEVRDVVEAAGSTFAGLGASVVRAHPTLAGGDDTFRILRAWHFQATLGPLLAAHPDAFKQSLADNIRAGEGLTGADVAHAYAQRTELGRRMVAFFEDHDVLVTPVSQVPPFPADQEFPASVAGQPVESYLDWMRSAYLVTVTGCPALSLPAGFTRDGLPVGIQVIAPHNYERRLLEIGAAFEEATGVGRRRPAL